VRGASIPVVTGIGHEIDFTLADLAADARAPTPSGAAELATPDRETLAAFLGKAHERLAVGMARELRAIGARLGHARTRLGLAHPGVRVQQQIQRLDDLEQRLAGAAERCLERAQSRLAQASTALERHSPARQLRELELRHGSLAARLSGAVQARIAGYAQRLGLAARALSAVSPLATLERGFAIVTRASDGTLVSDADRIALDEEIDARLAHGRLRARVIGKSSDPSGDGGA